MYRYKNICNAAGLTLTMAKCKFQLNQQLSFKHRMKFNHGIQASRLILSYLNAE